MKKNDLDSSQRTTLDLVRFAMHDNISFMPQKDINWKSVFHISCNQGVAAITLDGINKLHGNHSFPNDIPADLRLLWISCLLQHETTYKKHQKAIEDLSSLLAKYNIQTMILKGYGLSLNYNIPCHRPCGDIDIWLKGKQKEADVILQKERGVKIQKSSHHTIFMFDGCEIENHITILEHDTLRSNIAIDNLITKYAMKEGEKITLNGSEFLIPSVQFNMYFLLRHMAIHFCVDGISIRHLLDWATFVDKNSRDIKWEELQAFAKETNCLLFLDSINTICIDFLGYEKRKFPVLEKDIHTVERILLDIFKQEKVPSLDSNILKYSYFKTKRLWANRWKSKITNTDSFISQLWNHSWNRIKETYL